LRSFHKGSEESIFQKKGTKGAKSTPMNKIFFDFYKERYITVPPPERKKERGKQRESGLSF